MPFLTKSELKTNASQEIINAITKADDTTVEEIIEGWIDEMKTHMMQYDVEAIFNATDHSRSKVVLKNLKALVTHDVFALGGSDFGEKKYDDAIVWLEKVAKGVVRLELPEAPTEETDGVVDSAELGGETFYKSDF